MIVMNESSKLLNEKVKFEWSGFEGEEMYIEDESWNFEDMVKEYPALRKLVSIRNKYLRGVKFYQVGDNDGDVRVGLIHPKKLFGINFYKETGWLFGIKTGVVSSKDLVQFNAWVSAFNEFSKISLKDILTIPDVTEFL